ncbi:ABC transporter permease [Opitutus sp. ER46]|uniref:ABC transporter permease n=1 Tax=Opitutus sp. ER46 TaxID=2161864 RepID=UPI000D315486|nr:ABC transporter permease [Opitutus sp. ER46]PTX97794.1 hypothetical protein DB354_05820 [Opitutus sp. ER46]
MSPTFVLFRQALLSFRRARAAIVITFVVPVVLIYLFGHVFGLYGKESGPTGITLAVLNLSPEPAAVKLVAALQAEKTFRVITTQRDAQGVEQLLTEAAIRTALRDNAYRHALIIPADLLRDDALGVHLRFLTNPRNEIESQMVNGVLQKTVFSNVPQLLGSSLQRRARSFLGAERQEAFNGAIASAVSSAFGTERAAVLKRIEAGDVFGTAAEPANGATAATGDKAKDVFSQLVRFEKEQVAGLEVKNPMAARMVGGYAVMFLLFAVSGAANSLFEERRTGVFQRLLSSPVRPAHIVWARFLFGIALGLVQIGAMFVAGRIFFGLDLLGHAGALFAVALSAAAACSAFGLFVAAVAPSAPAASGIATFLVISMSAIGGAWFPVSFMPDTIQSISKLTLVYWSVEGFADVLWAGRPLLEILPKIGILAAMAAGVMAFSIWKLNRSRFFE